MPRTLQPTIVGVGQLNFGALFAQRGAPNDPIGLGAQALALAVMRLREGVLPPP